MNKRKRISVIIPTYNRQSLTDTLLSILHQTLLPDEVIIVDNNPNWETKRIVNDIQKKTSISVLYFIEKRKGAAYARNTGIRHATGSILAFTDDDCRVSYTWVEEIMNYFNENPSAQVLVGDEINGIPNNPFCAFEYKMTKGFFASNRFTHLGKIKSLIIDSKNCAMKKSIFTRKTIRFDNRFGMLEDIDLGLQIQAKNIPIYFNRKISVHHHGAIGLLDFLKKSFYRGVCSALLLKKWIQKKHLNSNIKMFFIKLSFSKTRDKRDEDFIPQSLWDKITFYTLRSISLLLGRAGLEAGKLLYFNSL